MAEETYEARRLGELAWCRTRPPGSRYLTKTRKRRDGDYTCLRCLQRFASRDAYDRHLVIYPATVGNRREDWCHLGDDVGLVKNPSGRWTLPTGELDMDPAIPAGGGVPLFPRTPLPHTAENAPIPAEKAEPEGLAQAAATRPLQGELLPKNRNAAALVVAGRRRAPKKTSPAGRGPAGLGDGVPGDTAGSHQDVQPTRQG